MNEPAQEGGVFDRVLRAREFRAAGPLAAVLSLALVISGCGSGTSSSPPPPPASLQLELVQVASGFSSPLDIQQPADSSGRLFVVQQGGRIRIIQNGNVLATPFLDLSVIPGFIESGGEKGLLGLAFHPNYAVNGRFFVNYTTRRLTGNLQTVIAEYQAVPPSSNTALATETILLTYTQPFDNHNGGGLAFGPDGFFYIASGDGGNGGDPQCNGQNLNTLLGKLLRIDVDSAPSPGLAYAIPPSNPFVGQSGKRGEIWAYGLRNPFRFSFDRLDGRLFIGDVGQDRFEEVDLVMTPATQGGRNFGWNIMEGNQPFSNACTQVGTLTAPIFAYDRSQGDETVIGGYVYHGVNIPALRGAYVFGDFISGRIWTLTQDAAGTWTRTQYLSVGGNSTASFGQDQAGELYVNNLSTGTVSRIRQVGGP